jgi:DnaJ family protein C protein 7
VHGLPYTRPPLQRNRLLAILNTQPAPKPHQGIIQAALPLPPTDLRELFQMHLFSKSPKKPPKKTAPTSDEESSSSRSQSPPKKSVSSSSSKSTGSRAKEENIRPGQGSARSSRSFQKSIPHSPRHPYDPNSHPLNLPPDQLRRLSALSSMSDPDRMDIDSESPVAAPTSPPPQPNLPLPFESPTPKSNGTNGPVNPPKDKDQEGPTPPPHKSNPTSPTPAPVPVVDEAEAFKAAGNKFYKAKEYKKAIEEYTKGKGILNIS